MNPISGPEHPLESESSILEKCQQLLDESQRFEIAKIELCFRIGHVLAPLREKEGDQCIVKLARELGRRSNKHLNPNLLINCCDVYSHFESWDKVEETLEKSHEWLNWDKLVAKALQTKNKGSDPNETKKKNLLRSMELVIRQLDKITAVTTSDPSQANEKFNEYVKATQDRINTINVTGEAVKVPETNVVFLETERTRLKKAEN